MRWVDVRLWFRGLCARPKHLMDVVLQTNVELGEVAGTGVRGTIAMRDLAAGENALSMPHHLHVNIGYKNWSDAVRRQAHQTGWSWFQGLDTRGAPRQVQGTVQRFTSHPTDYSWRLAVLQKAPKRQYQRPGPSS